MECSTKSGLGRFSLDKSIPSDRVAADMGSLSFTNTAFLDSALTAWSGIVTGLNGYIFFQTTNSWAPTDLRMVSNALLGLPLKPTCRSPTT